MCNSTDEVKEALDKGAEWVDVKKYGPSLSAYEAGLLAYARGMIEWHSRHVSTLKTFICCNL